MDAQHNKFLCRITKTLYFGDRSSTNCTSLPLSELVAELYNEVRKERRLDRLDIEEVSKLNQNVGVSTCSLVLAIMYVEKLKSSRLDYAEKVSPTELFLVSLLIASKYLNDIGEDDSLSNYEWSVCTGLSLRKVNRMEKDFLNAINWDIHVAEDMFWSRLRKMESHLAKKQGKQRGWYSYTEMSILLNVYELRVMREIIKQLALCVTCYTASLASVIASGLLVLQTKHFLFNCLLQVLMYRTCTPILDPCISSANVRNIAYECSPNKTDFSRDLSVQCKTCGNPLKDEPESSSNNYKFSSYRYSNFSGSNNYRRIRVSISERFFLPLRYDPREIIE